MLISLFARTATFCYVGRDGLQYFGAAAVEAFKANHTIASHTWGHIDMPAYSDAALVKDLKDNDDLIVSRIGVAPAWVRPPFGDVDQRTLNTIHGYGAKVLVWTFDSMDSNGMNGTQLTDFMLNRAKSEIPDAANSFQGPIILFHETKLESVKLIAQYIDIIRAKGYQIVDLAKCAGINADQVYKPRSTVPPSPPPPAPGPSPPPSPPSPPSPAASSSTTRAASTATTGAVFATASTSSTKAAGAAKIHGAELGFWIIVLAAILLAF